MFDAFIINMDHRTDRWESMQSNWSHIFRLHRIPGVKSKKKYHGCGQAHVNAFREACNLYPQNPFYIVMEDDVKPLKTKEYYTQFLETLFLMKDAGIDCVSLNSTFDKNVSTQSFGFHPLMNNLLYIDPDSNLLSGASFMIYSRNILKHMEEYQAHLISSFFIIPNDRLFTTTEFGFFKFNPLRCFIPTEMVCDLSDLAKSSDNFGGGAFHSYKENLIKLTKNSKFSISTTFLQHPLQIRLRFNLFKLIGIIIIFIITFIFTMKVL